MKPTREQLAAAENAVRVHDRLGMDVVTLTGTATMLAGIDFAPLAEFKGLDVERTMSARDRMVADIREAVKKVTRVAANLQKAVVAAKEVLAAPGQT